LRIRAEGYRLLGDHEKALEALSALAAADPELGAGVIYNEGVKAFNEGKMELAIAAFQQAIAVDPQNAPSYYSLGLAFTNQGENAKAKEAFQRFVELAPDDPDAATAKEMLKYL
jgi:superkiller protein 3